MCATDRLHSCLGKAEVLDLPFSNQVLHGTRHVLDWHRWINTMLIEQIDGIGVESPERRLGHLPDVLGPAIRSALLVTIKLEAELRRDHYLIPNGCERFAKQLFVFKWPVSFCRIEEGNTAFHGRSNQRDCLVLI